jgi:hypothetical protein
MNSDIIVLKAENKWIKNVIWYIVSIFLVVFILLGERFFNSFTIIFLTISVVVLLLLNFIIYRIKIKHDQYIRIEIVNKSNVKYYEKNECLFTFDISDIQSITYYSLSRYNDPVLSIDLKNKMNIYVSDLINLEILFTLNDQIEKEDFVSHFLEELWNPIFRVQNQLNLLNNQK